MGEQVEKGIGAQIGKNAATGAALSNKWSSGRANRCSKW
jgi:hypothetical protein